jgi:predicted site-specific integrase-resolvase
MPINEFVPIFKYAKLKGINVQNVYRWIREGKIPPDRIKKETITVERLRIKD